MPNFRLHLVQTALWIMLPGLVVSTKSLHARRFDEQKTHFLADSSSNKNEKDLDTYTINFNNIPLIEYVRFVGKITGSNFIFDENDLQVVVTIASEEPATVENIFSALAQVLRIHNLSLLEHEGNFIITSNNTVAQIPTVVSNETAEEPSTPSPLVTRVFRVKNRSADSIAEIIRAMVSQKALVSVSSGTNQLIITDVINNIEQIATLLASLDSTLTPLDVDNYVAKNIPLKDLTNLTTQILGSFKENNPLLLIPQTETNTIYIISTPHLIQRTMAVLQDLDIPPQAKQLGAIDAIFFYKIQHRTPDEILKSLKNIVDQLKKAENPPITLMNMMTSAKLDPDSHTILFTGDTDTYTKLEGILGGVDSVSAFNTQDLFIYQIQKLPPPQLEQALKDLTQSLKKGGAKNQDLVDTINSAKYLTNNSLIFSGTQVSFVRLKELLSEIDRDPASTDLQFLIYQPKAQNQEQLETALKELAATLKSSSAPDSLLIETIKSMTFIEESHAFVFTGDAGTLDRLKQILPMLDVDPESQSPNAKVAFYIYPIKNSDYEQLEDSLKQFKNQLKESPVQNKGLIETIDSAKYLKETNSIVFTGPQSAMLRLQELLPSLDIPPSSLSSQGIVFVYPLQSLTYPQLQQSFKAVISKLEDAPVPDRALVETMSNAQYLKETNSVLFTGAQTTLARLQQLLPTIDTVSSGAAKGTFFVYQLQHISFDQFDDALDNFISHLNKAENTDPSLLKALESYYYLKDTNSVVFTGTDTALQQVRLIMPTLDILSSSQGAFYIYAPQKALPSDFEKAIHQLSSNLKAAQSPNKPLIEALNSARYLKESNSFTFTGSQEALARLQEILPTLDVALQTAQSSFFVYKIQNAKEENLEESLNQFVKNLESSPNPDHNLIKAIRSMRFIKETNSLVFTGDQPTLDRLEKLLTSFDIAWASTAPAGLPASDRFFLYAPKYRKGDELLRAFQEMATNLKASGLADPSLLRTIESAKWIPTTGSLIFTGDAPSIENIKTLVTTLDVPTLANKPVDIYLYRPQYVSRENLEKALRDLTAKLDKENPADAQLKQIIASIQWMPDSQAFAFKGDADTLTRVKSLLASLDVASMASELPQAYFVYKLDYSSADSAKSYLETIVSGLDKKEPANKILAGTVEKIKIVKETNSLLISGPQETVEKIKQLLAQYDIQGNASSQGGKGSFFIYKPQNLSPEDLKIALEGLAKGFSSSGKTDPRLLETIEGIRYVENTKSLVISGSPDTLETVKELLTQLDVPGNTQTIHHVGATTFFIYKIQYSTATQLMGSLKSVARDLLKGGLDDQELGKSIESMKWIKETNSILFTGTDSALEKVQGLIAKFDIPALAPAPPSSSEPISAENFVIYHPQYKTGEELIELLCEFGQNLKLSGINNRPLFDTINNLRWIESTSSLIIAGDNTSIAKIQELIKQFDAPSPSQAAMTASENLGETGFLIYKLQYHQGDDIQRALRRIADSLIESHKGQKIPIAEAIEALQWIPGTNSLLTSASPDVLSRIRELIQNLDIPLRQVFIEVLIIRTTLNNNQSFGLSWAGRGQYKNQLASQVTNFTIPPGSAPGTVNPLAAPFAAVVPPGSPPSASNLPLTQTGLDLGIIGDIILHKGKTFFTLGSLVQALQSDTDSVVMLNPKIIAQDSNNATMFFGLNIPFTGSLVTSTSTSVTTSASLEYRNVGNSLSITPTLGSGDLITLDITEDLSETVGQPTTPAANQVNGIQTTQTSMATRVHVPDGHFVCLTGQIRESKAHNRTQIPCLGGLPIIGAAFGTTDRTNDRNNIIIFLRPQIIKTFDDYRGITQHQEDLFRERAGLPALKEEFDEGLDLVKTPENE